MVTASQQNLFRNNSADTLLFMRLPYGDSEALHIMGQLGLIAQG